MSDNPTPDLSRKREGSQSQGFRATPTSAGRSSRSLIL